MSYIYLASPYTHEDKAIEDLRHLAVIEEAVIYLQEHRFVYSPIAHCHFMARNHSLPGTIDFWRKYDEAMILRAQALHVLTLPEWEISKGILYECEFAKSLNTQVEFVEPRGEHAKKLKELAQRIPGVHTV